MTKIDRVPHPRAVARRALCAVVMAGLSVVALPSEAQGWRGGHFGGYGHGYYGHGGWGAGPLWGVLGLGLGLTLGSYYARPAYPAYSVYAPYPDYVYVEPPVRYVPAPTVYYDPARDAPVAQAESPPPSRLPPPVRGSRAPRDAAATDEPIFYPRNGQSAEQTEIDRRECNRWATTQPSAMADASIFQRATLACMDGHGYSGR